MVAIASRNEAGGPQPAVVSQVAVPAEQTVSAATTVTATTVTASEAWASESTGTSAGAANSDSDRDLLAQFLGGHEPAFAELVQRHGAMVLGVCQRVLGTANDADDAFQATFLVLSRKARALEWQDSIAGWLHQTARRTAMKLRGTTARRQRQVHHAAPELAAVRTAVATPETQASIRELAEILDEELGRLSARFREVILLSQIEGLSRDEIAERLGITRAAVKDRLERGREQLRSRLVRRGVTLSATALAAWLVPGAVQAATTTALMTTTTQAAGLFATSSVATGASPTAVSLAQGVLSMMGFEQLKWSTLCVVSVLTAGTIAYGMLNDEPTRFQKGLRGRVVSVNATVPQTMTVMLDEFETLLNLDVAGDVNVQVAFEAAKLADVREGQFVSLRLGDDHRTVQAIHVQGAVQRAAIQSVAANGQITVVAVPDDDDESAPTPAPQSIELAPDAILRIGGLPAGRGDLQPGLQIPLEFARDGKRVNAIEADVPREQLAEGLFVEYVAAEQRLVIEVDGDEEQAPRSLFSTAAQTLVTLDGKPVALTALPKGASVTFRLAADGKVVRSIRAVSPEADDDQP